MWDVCVYKHFSHCDFETVFIESDWKVGNLMLLFGSFSAIKSISALTQSAVLAFERLKAALLSLLVHFSVFSVSLLFHSLIFTEAEAPSGPLDGFLLTHTAFLSFFFFLGGIMSDYVRIKFFVCVTWRKRQNWSALNRSIVCCQF